MTHETVTIPGLADDDHRTLNLLLERLDQKSRRNRKRQAYYDMKHVVSRASSIIPPQYQRLGLVLGWSGKAVDTLARRCNLDGMVWPDGDLDSLGYSEFADDNNFDSEVSQAITSSLIHSVAFAINTQGFEGEPESLVHFKSALDATGEWNARKRHLDNLVSINGRGRTGADKGKPTSLALYLDGRTVVAEKVDGRWAIITNAEHAWNVPADPLVYKPRLGRPFGSSRISRVVMGLQDAATRTVIRLEAHGDIYTIPDLWLLGAEESIFKKSDGSLRDSYEIVMGRFKGVPDDEEAMNPRAEVKQFPGNSPQPHLEQFKMQAQAFSGETSIPLTSLGVSDMSNPTSADSYIASREDLIAEAEGAVDDMRPTLRRTVIRGLAMRNKLGADEIPDSWKTIDPRFRSPIYLSKAQEADAGAKQLSSGPEWLKETEVGLELLGLTPQQIKRAQGERRAVESRALLASLASRSGDARSDETVAALVDRRGDAG